eukprot:jgi/Psemu1/61373/gm1.61373_g
MQPIWLHTNPPNVRITEGPTCLLPDTSPRRPNTPTTRRVSRNLRLLPSFNTLPSHTNPPNEAQHAYAKESISKPSAAPPSFKEGPTRLQREYLERLYRVTDPVPCHRSQLPTAAPNLQHTADGLTFARRGPFGEAPARHEVYQAIYTLFTRSEGGQLLPLLPDLFNAQAIGGLGIFQEDAAGVDRLQVIHGLRRYPGTITQPSANLGRSFGYIDDVEGQECELVQVDAAMLSKAAASRVYLMAHHEAAISQHPDQDYIPAIPEGTAHTEMLHAHKVCFLPFEVVPLVLCCDLTPKQAFR